ncbi:MAG TPA: hypothetical protein VGQ42_05420 [Candidatus Dormibacteraeota bacterium]|jgi:hypothetical protein|nr:hypothetical protein [Candidatus Dormibacteraeota bacterium]
MRKRYGAAVAGIAGCVLISVGGALPAAATAAPVVSVVRGEHYGSRIFPDNSFTQQDSHQVTGLRVHFEKGEDYPLVAGRIRRDCDSTNYSICDAFAQLNKLDGFDIQPRVTVPFTGPIKLDSVNDGNLFITDDKGAFVSGLRQLTFDPATNTLAGISDQLLVEATAYRIHVTNAVQDSGGHMTNACGGQCVVRFTTRTASAGLVNIRKALDLPLNDPHNAYVQAGIPGASSSTAARKASFVQNGTPDVFLAATVEPSITSPANGIVRNDQVSTDPKVALHSSVVPDLVQPTSRNGYYAFGSYLSPRYQFASASGQQDNPYGSGDGRTDGEIPPVPTRQTAPALGYDRLGIIVVTPNPVLFPPPWPAAVYGPGFTRSKYDIFVTADYNASLGIMTVATDPSGHGYGPNSTTTVTAAGTPTTFLSYGRGRDLDGDGVIADGLNDGVGPTAHRQADGSYLPSHKVIDGLQSGLAQTVVDQMALGRSLAAGLDIPTVGTNLVAPSKIMYYGLSFGGIYGTMLMGTDPLFHQGLLNVPGGPIVDIARLSSFRGNLQTTLSHGRPNLLNGGPGLNGFTEDLPLRNDPPMVIQHTGAAQIQELFGQTNWYDRSGSPETFAPRIRLRPDAAWASNPKNVAFQTAYGDGTVPNPTAGNLYRGGDLFDRVVYYRNDKTPTYASDPHGWLADPTLAGRTSGEQQLGAFLSTGMLQTTNPAWLETPIANPNNLECLHYADPQTGQAANRQPFPTSGDCPAAPSHAAPAGQWTPPPSNVSTVESSDSGRQGEAAAGNAQAPHAAAAAAPASHPNAAPSGSTGGAVQATPISARSIGASLPGTAATVGGAALLAASALGFAWRRRRGTPTAG